MVLLLFLDVNWKLPSTRSVFCSVARVRCEIADEKEEAESSESGRAIREAGEQSGREVLKCYHEREKAFVESFSLSALS